MRKYIVFDAAGKILRHVRCPSTMAVNQLAEDEFLMEGDADDQAFKVVGVDIVAYTQEEKDTALFRLREPTLPNIDHLPKTISDPELNTYISNYYLGRVDVTKWRIDNYVMLRRWAYPPVSDYNDVQVKLNSGIAELVTEGETALNEYVQACLDVKNRFPKN